jgi:hypothetical protein
MLNRAFKRLSGNGDRHPASCSRWTINPQYPGASPRFRTAFEFVFRLALRATLAAAIGSPGLLCGFAKGAQDPGEQRPQGEITLVEDAKSRYTVVIAADAPLPVKFAAEELQRYLAQISGARLPVANDASADLAICVGQGSAPGDETDKLRLELKERGEDGYLMCISGKRLVLRGNSPRATLYAVYHFLEKHLGCGWCAPGDDTIPRRTTIRVPGFHEVVGPPAFSMRTIVLHPYGGEFMAKCNLPQTDWMAKNRFNWAHPGPNAPYSWERNKSREVLVPEVEKRGLRLQVGGHSFDTWLPPDRYAKDHPDYWNGGDVCLSHPDVARRMAENIVTWLDENPEVDAVDLWHNDSSRFCHCLKCAPRSERGSENEARAAYARTYVGFTNQVAALVARRHPKVLVNFLAYSHVTDCPAGAEPLGDNVLVGLCLFPRPTQRTMRPLETSPQELDRSLLRQIPAWQKVSKHFYIYEYYTFSNRHEAWKMVKFWSMVSMIHEDMRFLRRSGVKGLSSDQWAEGGWYPLNMYAFGKLAWNPDLAIEEIIADFCHRYYGRASAPMIRYWSLLEEGLRESWKTNAPVDWRDQHRAAWIEKALSQAESKTVQDRIRATFAMHKSYWPE